MENIVCAERGQSGTALPVPPETGERNPAEVWAYCERALGVPTPHARDPRTTLLALAERASPVAELDFYGEFPLVENLEARVAGLLGKEAAAWMPSGTMAQQIGLRIHADRRGNRRIAFIRTATSTSTRSRVRAPARVEGHLLGPRERLATAEDLDEIRKPVAAVLLELPQHDLGGQIPTWEDLVAFCDQAHERGAALHLDGRGSGSADPSTAVRSTRSPPCSTPSTSRSTRTSPRPQERRSPGRRT